MPDHDHGGHDHGGHDHGGHDHDDVGHDHDHGGHDHDHGGHDHDHGGHDHGGHGHSHDLRGTSKRSLKIALVLIVSFMFAEIIGGFVSGSLALIADAGHMLTDAASIALALVAMYFAEKAASAERTFGYRRLEILASLINALTLWLIAAGVMWEAYERFYEVPEIRGGVMLSVGTLGLLVNVAAAWVLHSSAQHSVNVEGAFRHVMADLLGSVGVVISGTLVLAFGWTIADPIVSVVIGILILMSTWGLLSKVVHVLLEGTPEHIDVYKLCSRMEELEDVTLIHDVHVWTLSPGYDALTAHILAAPGDEGKFEPLLRDLRKIAKQEFGIDHVTIQLEKSLEGCTEDHHVDHLLAHVKPKKK